MPVRVRRLPRSSAGAVFVVAVCLGVGAFWLLIQVDPLFREAIAPWRTSGFRDVMEWITLFGQGWVLGAAALGVALIAYWLGRPRLVRAGLVAVPALIASGLLARVIKIFIARPRPGASLDGVIGWAPSLAAAYNSFPSGHATSAFTLAAVLAVAEPPGRALFYAFAGVIAFSRVAVDAHFVSDVVAGGLLGWATGRWAMVLADRRWPLRRGTRGE